MLLETVRGTFINTDHVRTIGARWDKEKHQYEIYCTFANGDAESFDVWDSEWERLKEHGDDLIVPSPQGYFLLFYYSDEFGESIDRWPVLAWKLDRDVGGFHKVITAWNSFDEPTDQAILCPDGRVVELGSQVWDTEGHWLAAQQKKKVPAKSEP